MDARVVIRRLGFRKWYERELLRSHAHLVLLLLAALGLLGAFEALSFEHSLLEQVELVACVVVSAALGLWAMRRYLYLLNHAEYVADQAVCEACDSYAKWDLLPDQGADERQLRVRCRRCDRHWRIDL
ncbi:hypothetical protein [Aquabacterium sp. J223]|uniref:hypothetical protein n=1 Tax=Aquabacterium sp. J223 TaxID=2898431 RepID=UPI0021AE30C0|nr:hypothetical protein [Aquabacterium sp. J223]UUX94064.1 hypothetical protein LRS07_11970 [Aquabacterium sp. J223]